MFASKNVMKQFKVPNKSSKRTSVVMSSPMSFKGWAPELINGRLAQIGFLGCISADIVTGQSFTDQITHHPYVFASTCTLITFASFMPNLQGKNGNPEEFTEFNDSTWSPDSEQINGRAAMIGFVSMLSIEGILGHSLFRSPLEELASFKYEYIAPIELKYEPAPEIQEPSQDLVPEIQTVEEPAPEIQEPSQDLVREIQTVEEPGPEIQV